MEDNNHIDFVKNLIKQLLDNNFSSKELESLANVILKNAEMVRELEDYIEESTPRMITEDEFKNLKK